MLFYRGTHIDGFPLKVSIQAVPETLEFSFDSSSDDNNRHQFNVIKQVSCLKKIVYYCIMIRNRSMNIQASQGYEQLRQPHLPSDCQGFHYRFLSFKEEYQSWPIRLTPGPAFTPSLCIRFRKRRIYPMWL